MAVQLSERTSRQAGERLYASLRGKVYPTFDAPVEADEIIAYARSTRDDNPIRHEREAARAAGYADIVAPWPFLLALAAKRGQGVNALGDLGFTANHTLYGQQDFDCRRAACAGEVLKGRQRIVELVEKKKGTLLLLVLEIEWSDGAGETIAVSRQTLIVPLRGGAAA